MCSSWFDTVHELLSIDMGREKEEVGVGLSVIIKCS